MVAGSFENQVHQAMGGPEVIFCCCGEIAVCTDKEVAPDDFVGLNIGSKEMCCVASHSYKCQVSQKFPFMLEDLLPVFKMAARHGNIISNEGSETTQDYCPVQKSIQVEDEAKSTKIEVDPTMWSPMGRCNVAWIFTKIGCGHTGTQQAACEASGCCWQPAEEGSETPWCYHDSDFFLE